MTNISTSLRQLWISLEKRSRRNIILLFILNVINAFAEVLSIGSIIPIVSLLIDEKNINKYPFINQILSILPSSIHSKVLGILILFSIITIMVGIIRYVTLIFTNKLAFNISSSVAMRVYTNALYKPYPVHLQENSSETISNLTTKVNSMISGIFLPMLTFVNSLFIILSILSALMIISPLIALVIFVVFGGAYWIISKRSVKKVYSSARDLKYSKSSSPPISTGVERGANLAAGGERSIDSAVLEGAMPSKPNTLSKRVFNWA